MLKYNHQQQISQSKGVKAMALTGKVIKVKSWFYKQEQAKANKYNFTLYWDTIVKQNPETREEEEIGYCFVGDIVRETEKAVQVELWFYNLNDSWKYRYITDLPINEKRWKTWIPKSVIFTEGRMKNR